MPGAAAGRGTRSRVTVARAPAAVPPFRPREIGLTGMFLFFSNRLGCAGSLLLSAVVTVLLIVLLSR